MAKYIALANLKTAAKIVSQPFIRSYNRLESTPRSDDMEAGVSMETADPLWYLCRQWQFGEFQGEDAASAYQANILAKHQKPGQLVLPSGKEIAYDLSSPLETIVERENLSSNTHLSAQLGRYFRRWLRQNNLLKYLPLFLEKYPIAVKPNDQDLPGNYFFKSVEGYEINGFSLYESVLDFSYKNWFTSDANFKPAHYNLLETGGNELVNSFKRIYEQAQEEDSTWVSENLEYSFRLEARQDGRTKKVLEAKQFSGGHLDWKDFDQVTSNSNRGITRLQSPEKIVQTFIPAPLRFSGMPHPRLWQMEDSTTDFGDLEASKTTLVNMLLAEFGMRYSNDWFILPYEVDLNTICQVEGICVTDVFGLNFFIKPAIDDPEMNWQQFAFFHQSETNNVSRNQSLFYLAPAVGKVQKSEVLEQVNFMRDEMSNLVWATEQILLSADGQGRRTNRDVPSLKEFEPINEESKIRYVLGNTVPQNWFPFVPVLKKNSTKEMPEIRLQRARMPQGEPAQSKLLSEKQPVYFVEEKEVTRSGIVVERIFNRTRWLNGKTFLWIGRQKKTGRGEGNANLKFDQILDIK